MPLVGSLPCPLPPALFQYTHPMGINHSSNQDTVTRMRARCRDTHKGLLRGEWVSRPVARDTEDWRRGDRTPLPHLLRRPSTCPRVGMKAEDEAGEGSSSPLSLGPSPPVPCPLAERPGYS